MSKYSPTDIPIESSNSILTALLTPTNSPPTPSLLRKEGAQYTVIQASPPLYRAERKELARWASLVRSQTAEVAEGEHKG